MNFRAIAAGFFFASASFSTTAQQIDLGSGIATTQNKRQHVEVLSDIVAVAAAKPQDVEILFRVDPGFHINSHQPKDELLIPTALTLDGLVGLKLLSQQYPKGAPFKVAVGSETELLDVYTGEFRVGLRVIAPPGTTIIRGVLHYQACDNAACFPPRDLPIILTIKAK